MIRSAQPHEQTLEVEGRRGHPFLQGILTEVLNPKTALFFPSFIPQFVDARAGSVFLQFLVLGTTSVVPNTSADLLVALFAGPIGNRMLASRQARKYQRQTTGAVIVGLGIYVGARNAP